MAQTPRMPYRGPTCSNEEIKFPGREWSGEATVLRGLGHFADLFQTESAHFKLDGLVLVIEGVGRTKADGKLALQALGLVSYDDETGTIRCGQWTEHGELIIGNRPPQKMMELTVRRAALYIRPLLHLQ